MFCAINPSWGFFLSEPFGELCMEFGGWGWRFWYPCIACYTGRIFPASDRQYPLCSANFESSAPIRFVLSLPSPYSNRLCIFQIFAFSRIFGKYMPRTPIDKWSSLLSGSVIHYVMGLCHWHMSRAHIRGLCHGLMFWAYVIGSCHRLMLQALRGIYSHPAVYSHSPPFLPRLLEGMYHPAHNCIYHVVSVTSSCPCCGIKFLS